MAWLKLDDNIFLNPKVARCDAHAKLLYIVSLSYCANQLTDGFIPEGVLGLLAGLAAIEWQIAKQSASKLVGNNLWQNVEGGWIIPDFLDYNPSRKQRKNLSEARREAGKAGAMARWKQNDGKSHSKPHGKEGGKGDSKAMPPSPSPMIDRIREPEPGPEPEADTDWDAYSDDPRQAALVKIQQRGILHGSQIAQFNDLYDELEAKGVLDWIDKAAAIAEKKQARTAGYALKILINALHTGQEPGYENGEHKSKPSTPKPKPADDQEYQKSMKRQDLYERMVAEVFRRKDANEPPIPFYERQLDELFARPVDEWESGYQEILENTS